LMAAVHWVTAQSDGLTVCCLESDGRPTLCNRIK